MLDISNSKAIDFFFIENEDAKSVAIKMKQTSEEMIVIPLIRNYSLKNEINLRE